MSKDKKITGIQSQTKEKSFKKELEELINKHSLENDSGTADFILAEFMNDCLRAFNGAVQKRTQWYNDIDTSHSIEG